MEERLSEYQISDWLEGQCLQLWDIDNGRGAELAQVQLCAEQNRINGLTAQRAYVRDHWDKEAIMEYHMGNRTWASYGTIKWALDLGTSKIKMLEYYLLELGENMTPEQAGKALFMGIKILEADNKDERMLAYITEQYEYWDSLDEDELYEI